MEQQTGEKQLQDIITYLIGTRRSWDYVNNVLTIHNRSNHKHSIRLWLWWGDLLIAKPGQTKAGEMEKLSSWEDFEGNIIVHGEAR